MRRRAQQVSIVALGLACNGSSSRRPRRSIHRAGVAGGRARRQSPSTRTPRANRIVHGVAAAPAGTAPAAARRLPGPSRTRRSARAAPGSAFHQLRAVSPPAKWSRGRGARARGARRPACSPTRSHPQTLARAQEGCGRILEAIAMLDDDRRAPARADARLGLAWVPTRRRSAQDELARGSMGSWGESLTRRARPTTRPPAPLKSRRFRSGGARRRGPAGGEGLGPGRRVRCPPAASRSWPPTPPNRRPLVTPRPRPHRRPGERDVHHGARPSHDAVRRTSDTGRRTRRGRTR